MQPDLSVFGKNRGFSDYQRANEEFQLKKAMAAAEMEMVKQKLAMGAEAPSNVREYQFFNSLPQEEQQKYLTVKRAAQTLDLGSGYGRVDPLTNQVNPFGGGAKTLTPEQQAEQEAKQREAIDLFNRGLEVKTKALESVDRLLANPSGVRANRGGISTIFRNVSNDAVDAAADLDNVTNLLTTENLGLLKGVLSDTDMKVLQSIGSGELQGSDKKTMGALRRMKTALSGKVNAAKSAQSQGFNGMPPLLSSPEMRGNKPAIDPAAARAELARRAAARNAGGK